MSKYKDDEVPMIPSDQVKALVLNLEMMREQLNAQLIQGIDKLVELYQAKFFELHLPIDLVHTRYVQIAGDTREDAVKVSLVGMHQTGRLTDTTGWQFHWMATRISKDTGKAEHYKNGHLEHPSQLDITCLAQLVARVNNEIEYRTDNPRKVVTSSLTSYNFTVSTSAANFQHWFK